MSTPLEAGHRRELRGRGHGLKPVVMLGERGFTEAIAAELEVALEAHELIKVKLPAVDRTERDALTEAIVGATGAAQVQSIGRVLLLYRKRLDVPAPPARAEPRKPARRGTRQR